MRLVAGLASEATGMLVRIDLLEAFGLGRAGRMAANTEIGRVEFGGHDRGIVGVLCQGAVTGFAIDVGVLAGLLHLQDVRVASLAGLVAGKMDRACGNLADGGSAVVAVLAEAFRHDEVPDRQEDREGHDKQKRKPQQMPCILEQLHREYFLPEETGMVRSFGRDRFIDMDLEVWLYVIQRKGG